MISNNFQLNALLSQQGELWIREKAKTKLILQFCCGRNSQKFLHLGHWHIICKLKHTMQEPKKAMDGISLFHMLAPDLLHPNFFHPLQDFFFCDDVLMMNLRVDR